MKRGTQDEPETRIGMCCGNACRGTFNRALLFKVQGFFRYRCSSCYEAETGSRHYLDTRS